MKNSITLTLGTLLFASLTHANTYDRDALTIDKSVNQDLEFQFPNDNNIYPEVSDFEVVNYVTMSNEYGERKVTITLHNSSTGNRIFVSDQVMALYANGKRVTPYEEKVSFKGKETQTLTLTFNSSKYPILKVYTRN
ncbi:hypothetical protein [Kangiella geojedonensis]|uniref:Uncharacterized protein n=1 Tax=Kangiella geojedonensis TaxID=914150 RepID=A0A0F6TQZ4_9GAMM|nr:hypothetical protein [Kangiella geojedonensis]AKE52315.1 hypothetical protein TQ33_1363 [Kangiella geojedonensis]